MSIGRSRRCHSVSRYLAKRATLSFGGLLDPLPMMAMTPTATDCTVVALLIFAVILLALAALIHFKGRLSEEDGEQRKQGDASEGEVLQFVLAVGAEYMVTNSLDPRLSVLRFPVDLSYPGRVIKDCCWYADLGLPLAIRLKAAELALQTYRAGLGQTVEPDAPSSCSPGRTTRPGDVVEGRGHHSDAPVRTRGDSNPLNGKSDKDSGCT